MEFYLREITQGSKKKTYGLYIGEMKRLKTPIELKGRVIRYETIVKLKKDKIGNKMKGGNESERRITKKYRDDLFEMNYFNEILINIFNGNDQLFDLVDNSHEEIKRLINFIEKNHPNENKYYFIICLCFCLIDSDCDIIEYLINKLGLDRIIQIVYESNYNIVFNEIIISYIPLRKLDEIRILITKFLVFKKLLECYSQKTLEEFKQILMKLFSIEDKYFITYMDGNLDDIIVFFQNIKLEGFKLFEFLLEKKTELTDFIRFIKPILIGYHFSPKSREKIGTAKQESTLFNDI